MLNIKDPAGEKDGTVPLAAGETKVKVKVTLSCPNCGYHKVFKNQFERKHLDQLVVSAKVMSWAACDCGDLIEFSLEVEV